MSRRSFMRSAHQRVSEQGRRACAPISAQVARQRRRGRRSRPTGAAWPAARLRRYSRSGSAARASSVALVAELERRRIGDAGPHAQHLVAQRRRIEGDVARHLGPRADQAHVAAQHVDELRQLVELGGGAGSAPARRDARVGADGDRRAGVRGAVAHGAELVDAERRAVRGRRAPGETTPGRANRAGSRAPRRPSSGASSEQADGGDDDVEHALGHADSAARSAERRAQRRARRGRRRRRSCACRSAG